MAANQAENKYSISFHDSAWIPILNADNVLDYFCQRTNQFYDRTCNNEVVRMQRLDQERLKLMKGVEYELIHAQDPILYVIRKQMRHSPQDTVNLAVYYVLAGVVYQAPDLGSLINSRILSTVHNLEAAFTEVQSCAEYSPAKNYTWRFKNEPVNTKKSSKVSKKSKEPSSMFQRHQIDALLCSMVQKFPPKVIQQPRAGNTATAQKSGSAGGVKETTAQLDNLTGNKKQEATGTSNGQSNEQVVEEPNSSTDRKLAPQSAAVADEPPLLDEAPPLKKRKT